MHSDPENAFVVELRKTLFERAVLERRGMFDTLCNERQVLKWVQIPERFRHLKTAVKEAKIGPGPYPVLKQYGEKFEVVSAVKYCWGVESALLTREERDAQMQCPFASCRTVLERVGQEHECLRPAKHADKTEQHVLFNSIAPYRTTAQTIVAMQEHPTYAAVCLRRMSNK